MCERPIQWDLIILVRESPCTCSIVYSLYTLCPYMGLTLQCTYILGLLPQQLIELIISSYCLFSQSYMVSKQLTDPRLKLLNLALQDSLCYYLVTHLDLYPMVALCLSIIKDLLPFAGSEISSFRLRHGLPISTVFPSAQIWRLVATSCQHGSTPRELAAISRQLHWRFYLKPKIPPSQESHCHGYLVGFIGNK